MHLVLYLPILSREHQQLDAEEQLWFVAVLRVRVRVPVQHQPQEPYRGEPRGQRRIQLPRLRQVLSHQERPQHSQTQI